MFNGNVMVWLKLAFPAAMSTVEVDTLSLPKY
jgi:hypothetical protein